VYFLTEEEVMQTYSFKEHDDRTKSERQRPLSWRELIVTTVWSLAGIAGFYLLLASTAAPLQPKRTVTANVVTVTDEIVEIPSPYQKVIVEYEGQKKIVYLHASDCSYLKTGQQVELLVLSDNMIGGHRLLNGKGIGRLTPQPR
jgi:hypothetical protein